MENVSRSPRLRCFLKADITYAGGAFNRECQIKDLSDTGARIMIKDNSSLPSEFSIHIPNRPEVTRAEIKWRHEGQIGVVFLTATMTNDKLAKPLTLEVQLDAALAENARLTQRVANLEATVAKLKKSVTVFTIEEAMRAS